MLDRIVNLLAMLAGALLCLLIALICLDVFARNFKLFAIPWSLEVAEMMLYGMTFAGAPWVLNTGGHIAIDLLAGRLNPGAARILARATYIVGLLVSAVLLYYSVSVVLRFMAQGQMAYGALIFPKWWVYTPAPVTFLLMALIFLRWALDPEAAERAKLKNADGF